MTAEAFWLTPMGLFLDLWACHKQWIGMEKPIFPITVDDIIPLGCL